MVDREVPISAKLGGSAEVVVKGKVQVRAPEWSPCPLPLGPCPVPSRALLRPPLHTPGAWSARRARADVARSHAGKAGRVPADGDGLCVVRLCACHGWQQEDIPPGRARP